MFQRFAISLLLVAAAVTLGAAGKASPADLNLTDLNGNKVHLRDYRGKIVVLNFWATWCGPCREEMPMLVESEKAWASKRVTFIGVSLDEKKTQNNIPAFLKSFNVAFPIWVGATDEHLDKLKMGIAVPDTAIIDEEGIIRFRVLGEIKKPELEERLTWITGDRSGPAPKEVVRNLP